MNSTIFKSGFVKRIARCVEEFAPLYAVLQNELKDNQELLEEILGFYPEAYFHASERLRSTPAMYLAAIAASYKADNHVFYAENAEEWRKAIPDSIKKSVTLQIEAVKLDGLSPVLADDSVLDDPSYLVALAETHGIEHMAACCSDKTRKEYGSEDGFSPGRYDLDEEQAQKLFNDLKAKL